MSESTLERIEARRAKLALKRDLLTGPFMKRERGEEAFLDRERDLAEAELSRAATELLREAGFRATGEKPRKKKR